MMENEGIAINGYKWWIISYHPKDIANPKKRKNRRKDFSIRLESTYYNNWAGKESNQLKHAKITFSWQMVVLVFGNYSTHVCYAGTKPRKNY